MQTVLPANLTPETPAGLILGVRAIVNWQPSQQAIRLPVSRNYIAGLGCWLLFWHIPCTILS